MNHSDRYDARANLVLIWKIRANELYEAASLVWNGKVIQAEKPDPGLHLLYRPAQLLMGLCLEALLKGLIVEKNPSLIKDGKLPNRLKTHSLEDLFREADITLARNEAELNLARKLSDAVEWISKYPVPLKSEQLVSSKHRTNNALVRNDQDFERFEVLRLKVLHEFRD